MSVRCLRPTTIAGMVLVAACAGCTAQRVEEPGPTDSGATNTPVTTPTRRQTSSPPGPPDDKLEFRLLEAVRATRGGPSSPSAPGSTFDPPVEDIGNPYAWVPGRKWRRALDTFNCADGSQVEPDKVLPDQPLIRCDDEAVAHLMGPVLLSGGVDEASAIPPGGESIQWIVRLELDDAATADFDEITTKIAGSGQQLAITDGRTVISAPTVSQPISGGTVDITFGGDGFSEQEATALAERISR